MTATPDDNPTQLSPAAIAEMKRALDQAADRLVERPEAIETFAGFFRGELVFVLTPAEVGVVTTSALEKALRLEADVDKDDWPHDDGWTNAAYL